MPAFPFAVRIWKTGPNMCPPELNAAAPEDYKDGCVAAVISGIPGTWSEDPMGYLQMRLDGFQEYMGLTNEAASTLCVRPAAAYLWTIFYDPKGLVTPAEPLPPPPQ